MCDMSDMWVIYENEFCVSKNKENISDGSVCMNECMNMGYMDE